MPARTVDRTVALARGNPFWALELAAALNQSPENTLDRARPATIAALPAPGPCQPSWHNA
ncbi:MAG: hypothetical protein AUG49_15655 [Catenulispora sp. 13_1_20CM_3_70_7]|nr:MAG: hypothetical protein AUG49_15655 [Catenulispora sp. 13_1_20CM_3_70_7]